MPLGRIVGRPGTPLSLAISAQIRHHLLQRGVLRQQAFGQGLKVATRQL
jgi:hypothetical protein